MKNIIYIFFLFVISFSLEIFSQEAPKREVRGVWVATVANIDWPSSNTTTSGEQIAELVKIFDALKESGINTIYFQIRTECDALYNSSIEPWSFWLTGKQGKAPKPYFDPLEFAIDEAHSRGIELHAWFNPYRAVKTVGEYEISSSHISKTHPGWVLDFGKYKMLNPGIPEVTDYIVSIVKDVIERYDVDGIHFDDYFYPYVPKISTEDLETFEKYKGNFTNIDNWRRNNINNLISRLYETINDVNSNIKFGVSPFGIVENKYAGTNGFNSYNEIYCDPLTWLNDKTVDYVLPQLYWEIGNARADYKTLQKWWSTVTNGRDLYIGLFSSKMMKYNWKGSFAEIGNQVRLNRKNENVQGSVFFSANSIYENYSGFSDSLKYSLYKYPAIIPPMKWKDSILPLAPDSLFVEGDLYFRNLHWDYPKAASDGDTASGFVVYRFNQNETINLNNPKNIIFIIYKNENKFTDNDILIPGFEYTYAVTALDKMKNESKSFSTFVFKPKSVK